MTVTVEATVPAAIRPGDRFRFTHRGQDTDYVVAAVETDATLNPRARIVKLHRLDVEPKRLGDCAQVTEHWLRMAPPGYSGYWTFLP